VDPPGGSPRFHGRPPPDRSNPNLRGRGGATGACATPDELLLVLRLDEELLDWELAEDVLLLSVEVDEELLGEDWLLVLEELSELGDEDDDGLLVELDDRLLNVLVLELLCDDGELVDD
jgi:hypothetical protein